MEEVIFTWCSLVTAQSELSALIDLVEDGSLEEFFITRTLEDEVAGKTLGKEKALVFSFSKSEETLKKLENISFSFSLDEIDEECFEEREGEFTLKGVFYPESEAQEEEIINKLL